MLGFTIKLTAFLLFVTKTTLRSPSLHTGGFPLIRSSSDNVCKECSHYRCPLTIWRAGHLSKTQVPAGGSSGPHLQGAHTAHRGWIPHCGGRYTTAHAGACALNHPERQRNTFKSPLPQGLIDFNSHQGEKLVIKERRQRKSSISQWRGHRPKVKFGGPEDKLNES